MAGKTGVTRTRAPDAAPEAAILRALRKEIAPMFDERPAGAMTTKELANAARVSKDVIRRRLEAWDKEGRLRQARVRLPRGKYTVMYWLEEIEL